VETERRRRTLAPGEGWDRVQKMDGKVEEKKAQEKIIYGLPHAVRPLSRSELPVDAGGYRSAKTK